MIVSSPTKTTPQTSQDTKEDILRKAFVYLDSVCDGADARDGMGFSAAHVQFGKSLIRHTYKWTPAQAKAAYSICLRYYSQLSSVGIVIPDWETIAKEYVYPPKPKKQIVIRDKSIFVSCPYDTKDRWSAPAVLPYIKSIEPKAKFQSDDKSWKFPLDGMVAIALIREYKDQYEIDPELYKLQEVAKTKVVKAKKAEAKKSKKDLSELALLIEAAKTDEPMLNGYKFYEHQKVAVEWLLSTRCSGFSGRILADDLGLGKSLESLGAAKAVQDVLGLPIFVIAPASLQDNWLREASYVGAKIEVFTWSKLPTPLTSQQYLVIADEAHFAQSGAKSKRGKDLITLTKHKNCWVSWLLTGTPMKNGRPINMEPLLKITGHPVAQKSKEYQKRYCNGSYGRFGWDANGSSHLSELNEKIKDVMLRRTKEECLDLPGKTRVIRPVSISATQRKEYNKKLTELADDFELRASQKRLEASELMRNAKTKAKKAEALEAIEKAERFTDAQALVSLGHMRQVSSLFKIEDTLSVAEEVLESGQQIVIFTESVESAKVIHEKLGGELLHGGVSIPNRQPMVDRFQSGKSKVFVGTIRAGGVGITLTAASTIIIHDRPWTPGDAQQAEDRTYRIGQVNKVLAIWPQLENSIDAKIDTLLEQKAKNIEAVLAGTDEGVKSVKSMTSLAKTLLKEYKTK